jgi:formate hydrogenlyase subunit 6/NADH:ubiquinone oxidoreductase subunit I
MEACCGCGVCEDVCPIANCVTMVNEANFDDNSSQYERYQQDKAEYLKWLNETITAQKSEVRSHGLHHWGQYAEQLAAAGKEGSDGN